MEKSEESTGGTDVKPTASAPAAAFEPGGFGKSRTQKSTRAVEPAKTKRPVWGSIQDSLVANSCWLCGSVFRKGKVKKVFTVAHLLRFLKEKYALNSTKEGSAALISENLCGVWEAYLLVEGSDIKVAAALKDVECDTWMSGLICAGTEDCAAEYILIVPDGKVTSKPGAKAARSDGKDCPPDCDCDNPWGFIQAALVDKKGVSAEGKGGDAEADNTID
jgi:hypothetical protein